LCGLSQGDLPIDFTWYKDEKQLTKDDPWTSNIEISTLDPYSSIIRFNLLSAEMAGTYSCFASSPTSQTHAHYSAKLDVQGKEQKMISVAPLLCRNLTNITAIYLADLY